MTTDRGQWPAPFRRMGCIWAAMLLSACATNERKARQWAYANPGRAAEWCAELFPVRESELRAGRPVTDTIEAVRTDTLRLLAECPDGTPLPVECPPARTVTRTLRTLRTDTLRLRDRATERALAERGDALARKLGKTDGELERATERAERWRNRFLWAIAAAALLALWKVRK